MHRFSSHRLIVAIALAGLIPLAVEIPSLATLAILLAILIALISYEYFHFREWRAGPLRSRLASDGVH